MGRMHRIASYDGFNMEKRKKIIRNSGVMCVYVCLMVFWVFCQLSLSKNRRNENWELPAIKANMGIYTLFCVVWCANNVYDLEHIRFTFKWCCWTKTNLSYVSEQEYTEKWSRFFHLLILCSCTVFRQVVVVVTLAYLLMLLVLHTMTYTFAHTLSLSHSLPRFVAVFLAKSFSFEDIRFECVWVLH